MKVGYLFKNKSKSSFSVSPDASVTEAAKVMNDNRIGSLVVREGPTGIKSIVTERDILHVVGGKPDKLSTLKVRDIMAPTLITCQIADTVDHVMDLMINNQTGHRIRHLPVMDGDQFVGIISVSDIVEALLTETKQENNLLKSYIKNWPEE
ncbi:MAG: CBS domain-containing protein [Pseudomonadota bacterium]